MERERLQGRFERVRTAMERLEADWLLVPPSADFRWLTGAVARATERLLTLALPRHGEPFCLVPRLESDALAAECPWLDRDVWDEHEDSLDRLTRRLGLDPRSRVLLADGFRVPTVLDLARHAECRSAAAALAPLRAVKDEAEIHSLVSAGQNADRVVEEAADFMEPGMTERQVERFVLQRFEDLGDTAPWAIVASGPNSALPHHMSSSRRLATGDVVVLDVGAYTDGYGSDTTRTYWLGGPPPEAERIYEVVLRAQEAGVGAVRHGVRAEDVDRETRAVIEAAGYGAYFTHRTGHGVGLEIHEPPYIVAGNRELLRRGMVHSVEPGIYLPGRFGVRIEDLVVVGPERADRLNRSPRDPLPARSRV